MAHRCGEQAEVGLHSACRRGLGARSESPNGRVCPVAGFASDGDGGGDRTRQWAHEAG